MPEDDLVSRLCEDAVTRIGEHVDSIQILVTWSDEEDQGTRHFETGRGNWFTRMGQMEDYLIGQREVTRCEARRAEAEQNDI